MPEAFGKRRVMRFAPGDPTGGEAAQGGVQRTGLTHDLQADTAYEVAARVRFVELVAENDRSDWTCPAFEELRKHSADCCKRMKHQVLADEPTAVC